GSGLPTFVICHDFFPFCPALNISFHGVCHECTPASLARCTVENQHNRFFLNIPASYWPPVRAAFAQIVNRQLCRLIAPSASVRVHYEELAPELAERITVVPHGARAISDRPLKLRLESASRLRIVILGSLAPNKGAGLLEEMMPRLIEFADLYLVGCGAENCSRFEGIPGVKVILQYQREELPEILEKINPHLGLLLSIVPETFSFTLQELLELAIPVVCTRMGSFADRVEDGVNGFLCEPEAGAITARLLSLYEDREPLSRIHSLLGKLPRRDLSDMIEDYRSLSALPEFSAKAYFAPRIPLPEKVTRAKCQVRWRVTGEEFNETKSSIEYFPSETAQHSLRLVIPAADEEPIELRLDPADRSGSMLVRRLAVKSKQGVCLWLWDGEAGRIGRSMREDMEFLAAPDGGSGSFLLLSGNSPRFVLPADGAVCRELREGGVVEFDFVWFPPDRTSLQRSLAMELIELRNNSAKYESQATTAQQELFIARDTLEHVTGRVADLENSISWRWSSPLRSLGRLALHVRRWI
ncbi:MAG: glycosyltransferase, partial [Candidatus Solibacter sp.]